MLLFLPFTLLSSSLSLSLSSILTLSLVSLSLPVCVCTGGGASVSGPSRAGSVLFHPGSAARSGPSAGSAAGPAAGPAGHRTTDYHHPAWTDHYRTATARTGTLENRHTHTHTRCTHNAPHRLQITSKVPTYSIGKGIL